MRGFFINIAQKKALMVQHPWHEVSIGKNPPQLVNAIIEIPKGSRAKYEIDKESGLIKLDRVIYASMFYPLNYGFIPQTLGEDHDPLDIVVITQVTVVPRCLIATKVIGVMQMIDRGEADDKIIAVADTDPSVSHINDVKNIPPHLLAELRHFFENYKTLENKKVVVDDILGREKAEEILLASIDRYKKEFPKK